MSNLHVRVLTRTCMSVDFLHWHYALITSMRDNVVIFTPGARSAQRPLVPRARGGGRGARGAYFQWMFRSVCSTICYVCCFVIVWGARRSRASRHPARFRMARLPARRSTTSRRPRTYLAPSAPLRRAKQNTLPSGQVSQKV